MKPNGFVVTIGVAIVTIGIAQILTKLGVAESVDWPWTLGAAVAGTCLVYVGRHDRLLVGVGFFMFFASAISFLRQLGAIPAETAGSIELVVAGLLIVGFQYLPNPRQCRPFKKTSSSVGGPS